MKKTMILACCATALLFSACNPAEEKKDDSVKVASAAAMPADMGKVRTDIEAIEAQWAGAMNRKDMTALMALYADDAVSMQDGGPSLTGKAAIQADQEASFAKPRNWQTISFHTLGVYGSEEEVTEVGTSSEKDAAGKEVSSGKYMAIFRKIDGRYKCIWEIYNKDSK
ncbi:MAG: nuclear transport factor 2 family protein [Chitinophagaceae bacterium]|nr:MAG: nuclear transport factor 2 family protein [Chitinophagaceae bacterium]